MYCGHRQLLIAHISSCLHVLQSLLVGIDIKQINPSNPYLHMKFVVVLLVVVVVAVVVVVVLVVVVLLLSFLIVIVVVAVVG